MIDRSDKKLINILLPVWGKEYIKNFLQLSLRTLLAPGNIPNIAIHHHVKMIFLTKNDDQDAFKKHPAYKKLATLCPIEFIDIDDLIVFGNYSTTLTLAYTRAVRQAGNNMLNTYFVFLTSDYIMADGSLTGLMRYIDKGYSGICAGNFQVIKENINPLLLKQIDQETQAIQINPRKLLDLSFQYLHPIVFANMYDQTLMHNYYINRFFMRHNEHVLAGRFYLLHMLCIKPEVTNFEIGASCDYSFIPEMCPSGNVAIINDSDDYLVVESQSKHHELNYLSWGKYHSKKLIMALSEWTTHQHRENAKHTIYYHTNELTQSDKIAITNKFDAFIETISYGLNKYKTKPHRNHPYWIGAIKSFKEQSNLIKNSYDYDYHDLTLPKYATLIKRIYYYLFGTSPKVYRWHHRYHEYQSLMKSISQRVTADPNHTVVLYAGMYSELMRCYTWLKKSLRVKHQYNINSLIHSKTNKIVELQNNKFSTAFLMLTVSELKKIHKYLPTIKTILKPNTNITLLIPNEAHYCPSWISDFTGGVLRELDFNMIGIQHRISKIETIHNDLTMLAAATMLKINRLTSFSRKIKIMTYAFFGGITSMICMMVNSIPMLLKNKYSHCTHILITIESDTKV